jgi:carbonic anhydrase/acetyltransferase-like protein (isoleucine patch superfamily)
MSVTILPFGGIAPRIAADAFIAPGTRVIGNVQVGALASIWYNCVLRGDIGKISIGARTNVQDGTVIHVTGGVWDTDIGEDVLIGHLAMLHGCKLHNFSFVGLGSIVMDGCEIEPQACQVRSRSVPRRDRKASRRCCVLCRKCPSTCCGARLRGKIICCAIGARLFRQEIRDSSDGRD